MTNPQVSNPNDYKVVVFKNTHDFDFSPEMGCMYDSRPIFGISGYKGIAAGESMTLPYHVAHQLAKNLAKAAMIRNSGPDKANIPTGVPIWDENGLDTLKASYLTEMYSEDKPIAQNETDRMMAKIEELKNFVEKNINPVVVSEKSEDVAVEEKKTVYQDKAEVIAELEKRGIKFDARQEKAVLEKLLA